MFKKIELFIVAALATVLLTACGGEDGSDVYVPPGYGSIALDKTTGRGGITSNYSSQGQANSNALDTCGAGCATVFEFGSYMCGALARGTNFTYGWASNSRKSNAEGDALSTCQARGGVSCSVVLSQCNDS